MIFAETGQIRHAVQGKILRAVLVYVIADGHKFFHMLLLLIVGHVKGISLSGELPAYQYQHGDQLGIDGSADQDGVA